MPQQTILVHLHSTSLPGQMHAILRALARRTINVLPRQVAGKIVSGQPRLVAYLDESDLPVRFRNCYYGDVTLILSSRYRIERFLLYDHAYDEKLLLSLMRIVSPGDVCLDVGANIGAITLSLAHRVGPGGRVLAFEPGPLLFDRLTKNIERNRLGNVSAYQVGLGSHNAMLYWRLEEGENAGNAFISSDPTGIAVHVATPDEFVAIQQLPRIDLIKIDVEGMELSVIQGALGTIRRFKPCIIVETRTGSGPLADHVVEMLALLAAEGYEDWDIDVPRDQLTTCKPSFNFVRCKYPDLPQNTLFVHASRGNSFGLQ